MIFPGLNIYVFIHRQKLHGGINVKFKIYLPEALEHLLRLLVKTNMILVGFERSERELLLWCNMNSRVVVLQWVCHGDNRHLDATTQEQLVRSRAITTIQSWQKGCTVWAHGARSSRRVCSIADSLIGKVTFRRVSCACYTEYELKVPLQIELPDIRTNRK